MKPIKFKEQNCIFAENQPEYTALPAHKVNDENIYTGNSILDKTIYRME